MKKRTRALFLKVITFFQIFSLTFQPLSLLSLFVLDPVVARAQGEAVVEEQVIAEPVVEAGIQAEPAAADDAEEIIEHEDSDEDLIDVEEDLEEESEEESEEIPPVLEEEPSEDDASAEADLELSIPEPTLTLMPTPMPTVAMAEEVIESKEDSAAVFSLPRALILPLSSGAYSIFNTSGVWTSASPSWAVSGTGTSVIKWGESTYYDGRRSGLEFTAAGNQNFDPNETFLIGQLTHMNWPVSGTTANSATLKVTLNFSNPTISPNPTFSYTFYIEETTNSGNCPSWHIEGHPKCDDRITFPSAYGQEVITIGDVIYTLKIDGFQSAYPEGSAVSQFITEESKDNTAFLVGHLSSVLVENPEIRLTKKTNDQDVAAAPGPELKVGDAVTWEYIIQNTGNVDLTNISITDVPAADIDCDPNTEGSQNSGLSLASGASMTCTASGTVALGQFTNTATVVGTPPTGSNVSASDTSWYNGVLKQGTLIVKKVLINDNGGTKEEKDFSFKVNNGSDISFEADGQNEMIVDVGTYNITENAVAGYASSYDNCSNVTVVGGGIATCTITNDDIAPKLTLNKIVSNTQGGNKAESAWTLYAKQGDVVALSGAGASGNADVVSGNTFKAGVYTLSEEGPAGYTASDWSCTGGSLSGNQIALDIGQEAVCSITNRDNAGKLTVIKNVINDNGGNATVGEFEIKSNGATIAFGNGVVNGSTTKYTAEIGVKSNTEFTLTEKDHLGYTEGTWSCKDDSTGESVAHPVTLSEGQKVTCAITNDDIQPKLTVTKIVSGGSKVVGDFDLYVGETEVTSGEQTGFNAGTYTVSEDADADYNSVIGEDCALNGSITLAPGDVKECTITNTRKTGQISFIKNVTYGDALPSNWTFNVYKDGVLVGTYAHSSSVALDTGAYTVQEVGPGPYYLDSIGGTACTGTVLSGVAQLTVTEDGGTCIFGNSKKPQLTVTKVVNPADSQDSFGFTITKGNDQISTFELGHSGTKTVDVVPGSYTITESGATGYSTEIKCSDDITSTSAIARTISLSAQENKSCTFTNTKLGSISGTKWNDVNGDGIKDEGEEVVEGVQICIDVNANNVCDEGEISVATDASGNYTFSNLLPGTYTIIEKLDSGWEQTYPAGSHTVVLSAGELETGHNFGNWELKPGIKVVKSSTTTSITAADQVVPYTFTVTNTGNQTLTGITVTDPRCTSAPAYISGDTNSDSKLQTSEAWTYTCNYTAQQSDIDAGGNLSNTVTASSTEVGPVEDTLDIPITQSPDMSVTKDADLESVNAAGQLITYTIKVFNDGNTTLKNVSVEDQLLSDLDCDGTAGEPYTTSGLTINVGSNLTCTGTYTVTQDDIDSKAKILNTVTAKNTVTDPETDDEEVDVVKNPELSIVKSGSWVDADEDGYADVGETISYTFTVKNEGNVTLTDITVEDLLPNLSAVSCPATTLAVGKDMTCTASYEITQADIDAGKVENIATADSEESEEETDDEEVDLPHDPKLSIVKSGTFEDEDGDGFADVGETISYTFTVKNEGNVTLTNVTVTDPLVTVSGGPITLNVGETDSTTFTASYTITQEDINMGSFYNIATADSDESDPDTGDTTVELPQNPKLSIFKTGVFEDGDDEITNPGDLITYSFLVTNTGNITLTGITVTDPLSGLSAISCPASTLAVGGSTTCTATYAITQADIDVGKVDNTATADSTEKASDEDDATVELPQNPALGIVKTATPLTYDEVGDVIDYSFEVTNTGNVTLTGPFTVSDDKATDESCPDTASLTPGATITCTASYEITLDDLDAESVTNVAFAEGYFGETPVVSPEDTETVTSTAGKITVYKYYDVNRDGVKDWDEATLADWEMVLSSDEEEDSIKQSTAESGSTLFYLPAGDWQLSETMQEDWEQTGIYCEHAGEGELISLPGEGYGCHGQCSGWNACGDAATCALWACNIKGYANLVSYGKDYPCTQLNNCHLFNYGPGSIQWNWGNWCAVSGVTDIYCSNGNGVPQRLVGYDSRGDVYQNNAYNLTVNPGDKKVCYVGNALNSQLMIEKTNDAWPNDQEIGDEVTYTIKLMATDGPVYDVSLFDLPPNAFSYVAGSYMANSSITGDLSLSEPNYASPGTWQLGDLAKDEIITVSYKAIIGDEADAGIYPDAAWATGTSSQARYFEEEADLLALSDPDFKADNGEVAFLGEQGHYGEEHFVGTRVAVVTDETPSAKYKVEKIKEKEGTVLGASLPATGANFWLSLLAILSILTGTGLLLVPNRKRRQGKVLMMLLMLGLGLLMAKPVQAITSVRLAQPYNNSAELDQDAITNQDKFRIDFVVLNTEGLSLNAQCQQQEDGGAWTNIDTFYTVKAGGNSGYCEAKDLANSSQYAFRVLTSDGEEGQSVKVALDTDRPKTPVSYEKNRISSCKYEIKFKTADDGRTSKVEVYRSDDNVSFTAKASSRIKTIVIGSDEKHSFETTRPDCDKDYYYAIRAFDQYGNASDLVGDREVKTVIVEGTGEAEATGALAVTEIVILDGDVGDDGVLSEGLLGEEVAQDEKGTILGIDTESLVSFLTKVLLPILVFVTISVLVYRLVIAKRNEKK